jgi:hypothetical protein
MARKQSRKCIFCARGNLSKEHFWPAWATEHLPDAVAREETLQIAEGAVAQTRTMSRPGSLKHKKLRLVCEPCNNEWMSVIENDAKRVVLPMLLGQSLFLDEGAQRMLARWIALKVMVVDQSRPDDAVIGSEERKAFMEQGTVPERLYIELARCGVSPWNVAMARQTANLFPMEMQPSDLAAAAGRKNIQTTTFGIGQLVIHCIARAADAVNLAEMVVFSKPLIKLWPLTGSAIIWPPKPLAAWEVNNVALRMDTLTKSGKVNYIA